MLTVVTWKWNDSDYRATFTAQHVNLLALMVAEHYRDPHEVVCVTDDPSGLDPRIRHVPLWDDHRAIRSPHSGDQPACYLRLKAFSREAREWFGPRFVSIDLDVMLMDDMRPLWNRPEPFVIWHHRHPSPGANGPRTHFQGTMWMMDAGVHDEVWSDFAGEASAREAYEAGHHGSDQGWMNHKVPKAAAWKEKDGLYSFGYGLRGVKRERDLPKPLRVVSFHGPLKPWMPEAQAVPWVRAHYPIWAVR